MPFPRLFSALRARTPFVKAVSWRLLAFATWAPALVFFNTHVGCFQDIHGSSMYPFLNTDVDRSTKKDVVWTNKVKPWEGLRRGMVVVLRSPSHPETEAVKRIIGLPGDKVYTKPPYPFPIAEIPPGHVWVEGDGAHAGKESLDSNRLGPVAIGLILGKVEYVVWPWEKAGRVRWEEWKGRTKVFRREEREDMEGEWRHPWLGG